MSKESPGILIARSVDALVIGLLVFGNQDARDFSWWMVLFMVLMSFIMSVFMDKKTATGLVPKNVSRMVIRISVCVAYVGSLIYAGFPVLAAAYALTAFFVAISVIRVIESEDKQ